MRQSGPRPMSVSPGGRSNSCSENLRRYRAKDSPWATCNAKANRLRAARQKPVIREPALFLDPPEGGPTRHQPTQTRPEPNVAQRGGAEVGVGTREALRIVRAEASSIDERTRSFPARTGSRRVRRDDALRALAGRASDLESAGRARAAARHREYAKTRQKRGSMRSPIRVKRRMHRSEDHADAHEVPRRRARAMVRRPTATLAPRSRAPAPRER
jgi:hypothetical protein